MGKRRAVRYEVVAPGEGEPTGAELRAIVDREGLRIGVDAALVDIWRAGVAHERARHAAPVSSTPVTSDRATDEELVKVGREAWTRNIGDDDSITAALRATTLAVAAHVRKECLVAQAVGMGVSLEIGPHSKGVDIYVSRPREDADGGEYFEGALVEAGRDDVPPSEVPTTLARLLGEVSR